MPDTLSGYLSLFVYYMSPSMILAIALVAALVCFALYAISATPAPSLLSRDGRLQPRLRFCFSAQRTPMTRRDALLCLAVTVIYAFTAFFQLGSTAAPQSTVDFYNTRTVEIELSEKVYVTELRYFPGLGTGAYDLEISSEEGHWSKLWTRKDDDGNVTSYYWADAAGLPTRYAVEQRYLHLFKWNSLSFENPQYIQRIRITARCERDTLQLGELALYNTTQSTTVPLAVTDLSGSALFDEQDTIPASPTWYDQAYFDEIYHPRTALEHIENFQPYETTHPPLGKLIIGLGIRAFGMTPFGWRFMGTLFGAAILPFLYVFLKNFFGKTPIALCGTVLLATDFMHLTQTRLATIDTYAVFFILTAYFFLYRWISLPQGAPLKQGVLPLFLSGLMFGIGVASKWTVLYAGAGMALLYLLNMIFRWRDRSEADAAPFWPWCIRTILLSVLFFVIIPLFIYTASYYPYALDRGDPSWKSMFEVMLANQTHMFSYHQGVSAPHPYQSKWWMWILNVRPILYYMEDTATTVSRFAAFVNPVLCWGGLAALILAARAVWQRRDGKALFLLVGYLSQLVPWIPISRPTFNYHYFPSIPFLVLALCFVFNDLAERKPLHYKRWIGGITAASAGLYALFYPVLTGLVIPEWYSSNLLRWLPSWPF